MKFSSAIRLTLIFLLLIIIDLSGQICSEETAREYEKVTKEQLLELINRKEDFILIDNRTQEEYEEGHIPGAVLIPVDSFTFNRKTRVGEMIQKIRDKQRSHLDFILKDSFANEQYISAGLLKRFLDLLPTDKDRLIILYDRRSACTRSSTFAHWMKILGYRNVKRYVPGWAGWQKEGYRVEKNHNITYTPEQIYFFDVIKNRRTVRKFKPTPVPIEHILKILDAAHYAPSARNEQAWKFLVIQDREKLDRLKKEAALWYLEKYRRKKNLSQEKLDSLKKTLRGFLQNVLSAPIYVAVLADTHSEYPEEHIYCTTLAAENLFIAARSLGYGTGFYTTFFPSDNMKKFFHIPERYRLICFTPIGVPEEWPEMPPKKKLEDVVVFESF